MKTSAAALAIATKAMEAAAAITSTRGKTTERKERNQNAQRPIISQKGPI
jgi:hypothetical protein